MRGLVRARPASAAEDGSGVVRQAARSLSRAVRRISRRPGSRRERSEGAVRRSARSRERQRRLKPDHLTERLFGLRILLVNPQRGPTVERPERPLPSPASDPRRSGPYTGRDERNKVPRRPPNTRPCAREGKSNNHRAFTYNHCVPCRTRQFHASPAAARLPVEPAVLPDERLRQLPRGRPDHGDGQLPDLRVRPPAALTRAATPTRARRSRSARRSWRTRSSWCR